MSLNRTLNFWTVMSSEFREEVLVNYEKWLGLPPSNPQDDFPFLNLESPPTISAETAAFLYGSVVGAETANTFFSPQTLDLGGGPMVYYIGTIQFRRERLTDSFLCDLLNLQTAYPNDFDVVGLWHEDGLPVGAKWVTYNGARMSAGPLQNSGDDAFIKTPAYVKNFTSSDGLSFNDRVLASGQLPRIFVEE